MRYFCFLVLFAAQMAKAQQPLMPYRKGKLWGYSDTSGNIVLQPQFDGAKLFDNKRDFTFVYNHKLNSDTSQDRNNYAVGLVDKRAKVMVPPLKYVGFEVIGNTMPGYGENVTFYTKKMLEKINQPFRNNQPTWRDSIPLYFLASKYYNEYYELDSIQILNAAGKLICDSVFNKVSALSYDGSTILFRVKNREHYGLLSASGILTVPIQYSYLECVNIEQNVNYIIAKKKGKFGLISSNHKVIIPFIYDDIRVESYGNKNERILIGKKDKQEAAYTATGKLMQPLVNGKIEMVDKGAGSYGVIVQKGYYDRSESEVIYDNPPVEMEGLAASAKAPDMRYVSSNDEVKVANVPTATKIIKENNKYGLTLNDGVVVAPTYDTLYRLYIQGYYTSIRDTAFYKVEKNGKKGVLDMYGKVIIPIKYLKLNELNAYDDAPLDVHFIAVDKKNRYGLINLENIVTIPFKYDTIYYKELFRMAGYKYGKRTIHAENKKGTIVYDINGKALVHSRFANIKSMETYICNVENKQWLVHQRGLYGIINARDSLIIPINYKSIEVEQANTIHFYYKVKNQENKYGFINLDGKSRVACKYDQIKIRKQAFNDDPGPFYNVVENGKFGIYDVINNKEIIKCDYNKPIEFLGRTTYYKIVRDSAEGIGDINVEQLMPPIKGIEIIQYVRSPMLMKLGFFSYKLQNANTGNLFGILYVKNGKLVYKTEAIYEKRFYESYADLTTSSFKFIELEHKNWIDYIGYNGVRFFEDE